MPTVHHLSRAPARFSGWSSRALGATVGTPALLSVLSRPAGALNRISAEEPRCGLAHRRCSLGEVQIPEPIMQAAMRLLRPPGSKPARYGPRCYARNEGACEQTWIPRAEVAARFTGFGFEVLQPREVPLGCASPSCATHPAATAALADRRGAYRPLRPRPPRAWMFLLIHTRLQTVRLLFSGKWSTATVRACTPGPPRRAESDDRRGRNLSFRVICRAGRRSASGGIVGRAADADATPTDASLTIVARPVSFRRVGTGVSRELRPLAVANVSRRCWAPRSILRGKAELQHRRRRRHSNTVCSATLGT